MSHLFYRSLPSFTKPLLFYPTTPSYTVTLSMTVAYQSLPEKFSVVNSTLNLTPLCLYVSKPLSPVSLSDHFLVPYVNRVKTIFRPSSWSPQPRTHSLLLSMISNFGTDLSIHLCGLAHSPKSVISPHQTVGGPRLAVGMKVLNRGEVRRWD